MLNAQLNVGDIEAKLLAEYGAVYRVQYALGVRGDHLSLQAFHFEQCADRDAGTSTPNRRPEGEAHVPAVSLPPCNISLLRLLQALQHILHKSGYHFPKSVVARTVSGELTGAGILVALGTPNVLWVGHSS